MSGRYAESQYGEKPVAVGVFLTGDTVTIQVLNLATDALIPLDDNSCTESAQISGLFLWDSDNFTTQPTDFTQLVYVMTNVAGRQHPGKFVIGGFPSDSAVRRFDGSIHIDVANGSAGQDFPIGTPTDPSNNEADARAIAVRENILAYTLNGPLTLTVDHEDWTFYGVEPIDDFVIVQAGASVAGSEFSRCGIYGDLSGAISATECTIGIFSGTVTGLQGTFTTCGFNGTIQPEPGGLIQGLELASQNANGVILDFNDEASTILAQIIGVWNVRNIDDAGNIVVFALDAAWLNLESTVESGYFLLLGQGELSDSKTAAWSFTDFILRGSRVDAQTSSRATQAQILSDATPFAGADIASILTAAEKIRKVTTNRVEVNSTDTLITVYEDDDSTPAFTFTISVDRRDRTPV
jgi:hypothetical protein